MLQRCYNIYRKTGIRARRQHAVEIGLIQTGLIDSEGSAPGCMGDGVSVGYAVSVKQHGSVGGNGLARR